MDPRNRSSRGRRLWAGLIVAGLLLALPSFAAEPAVPHPSPLEGVKELEKPVTYSETKIPLGELVQKVAADTGVKLTAARDVADEPIATVVKEMPARELLEQLADLLDYRWSRQGKPKAWRFEIYRDLASTQREAALREELLAGAQRQLREEVRRAVEMAGLSQEQIMALREARDLRARELAKLSPEQQEALMSMPEAREQTRRFNLTTYLWSPISRSLGKLLGQLSAEQWTRLREDRQLSFSTNPQPGELPLPEEMARTFREAPPSLLPPGEHMIFPNEIGGEERLHQREEAMQQRWTGAAGYRVTLRCEDRLKSGGSLHLSAGASPIDPGPPPPSYTISSGMQLALDVAPLDLQVDQAKPDSPQRRADLEKDPVLGVKKPLRRETGGPAAGSVSAPEASPPRLIQDLLPELARTYGASFISDAYWRSAPIFGLPPAGEPIALFTLLDRLARPACHWDQRGPLIRLRSRTWFLDRPREVPLRFVRRWKALLAQHASLPLETYLEVAALLRDEQLASLGELTAAGVLPRELPDLQGVYAARHALRLYASLTPPQREALRRGVALPFERLLPMQRELFLAAVRENSRYRTPPLDRTEWVAGSFSLASENYTRVQEEQAGVSHYRREDGTAAGAPPTAAPRAPGERVLPSLPRAPAAPSASPPVRVTRYPVTRVWFFAERGSERLRLGFITIPAPS